MNVLRNSIHSSRFNRNQLTWWLFTIWIQLVYIWNESNFIMKQFEVGQQQQTDKHNLSINQQQAEQFTITSLSLKLHQPVINHRISWFSCPPTSCRLKFWLIFCRRFWPVQFQVFQMFIMLWLRLLFGPTAYFRYT